MKKIKVNHKRHVFKSQLRGLIFTLKFPDKLPFVDTISPMSPPDDSWFKYIEFYEKAN